MASTPAVGAPQKEGAEGFVGLQAIESNGVQYSDTSKSRSPTSRLRNNEVSSSGDELTTKVRKPYTITKQRERWTEEEHQKFLEALKMHGRAWRRIEEHIGTKTAVQIRSHAQKFFSKLEREASARGKAQDISIPPPRPKRKPSHPYPRKAGTTLPSGSSANEEENKSPRAVSSASDRLSVGLNLGGTTRKNAAFTPYSAKPGPLQTKGNINLQEIKMDSSSSNSSPSSLKLFGKTVVVPTNESSLDDNAKGPLCEFTSLKQETTTFEGHSAEHPKLEDEKGSLPTITLKPHSKLTKARIVSCNIPPTESGASALEGTGESNGNSPCQENHTGQQDSDEQLSSELDNNSNYLCRKHQGSAPVLGYPRHVPVQHVETITTDDSNDSMKDRPNAVSLAHDFAAMSMLSGNSSLSNMSGQMQNDVHNSLQPNILLPFTGMQGPFCWPFNNLENVGCVSGFFAPGSVPNGPLPPWLLTPSAALHQPTYAAATLAAAGFWPGLVSGTSGATMGDPQPSSSGVNGHILCDETTAAAAVTAATVAAASAWWTLHGAIPPFLHPGIYSPIVAAMAAEAAAVAAAAAASGNSSAVCKTEPIMETRKQEQVRATKVDNGVLDEMPSIPHAKDDGKLSMEQLDDGNECLPCPNSESAKHLLHDSASGSDQNPTSCMEESCDAEMQIEKQNCNTEEKEHNARYTNLHDGENTTNRKFIKERSSSGSNTLSSAEPETDTYLETNLEVIKGNDEYFESNGNGNCSSEAGVVDPLTKNIEGSKLQETLGTAERESNHSLAYQEEIKDDNRKHVHKDRHQSHVGDGGGRRSKSGCHVSDQWKPVSEEGRIAFQALFARDVLPQSFSPPQSIDGQEKTPKSTEASLCDEAKKETITMSSNEMQIDIQKVLLNNSKVDDVDTRREEWCAQETPYTAALPAQEKNMQDSEATISDRSLEEHGYCGTSSSPNENVSTDFKSTKSSAISSFGNFRSGRGFVPYQRCSVEAKKNRLHTRPTPNYQDDVREEKRICLEQGVKET